MVDIMRGAARMGSVKENRTVQIAMRITEAENTALRRIAEVNGSTLASTLRLAMMEFLRKEENRKKLSD